MHAHALVFGLLHSLTSSFPFTPQAYFTENSQGAYERALTLAVSFEAAARTSEIGSLDWREVVWDTSLNVVIIQWWQSKTAKVKPVVWLPSNGVPEVDVYLLMGAAAMTGFFNQRVPGLSAEANGGEEARVFKIMSKLTEAEKKVKRDGDGGNEDESGLSKRIASFLNDVSVHSTNPTFRPYASRLLHDVYSGTSLRRGAVAQARAMGLQLDDIASATGHSITLPGGFNSGTVRSGPPTLRELVSHRTFCAFVHTFCPIPHAWAWRAYYLLRGRRVQHPNPNRNYAVTQCPELRRLTGR
jgi:hypothetical protein